MAPGSKTRYVPGTMYTDGNPVGWFEIYVQNIERAKVFYQNTFELTLQRLESTDAELWAFPMHPDKSGATGAIVKMNGKDSGGGGTIVYFVCDDCSIVAERAEKNGGRIERPKFSIGQYGFICFVTDPDGNRIGLHSRK